MGPAVLWVFARVNCWAVEVVALSNNFSGTEESIKWKIQKVGNLLVLLEWVSTPHLQISHTQGDLRSSEWLCWKLTFQVFCLISQWALTYEWESSFDRIKKEMDPTCVVDSLPLFLKLNNAQDSENIWDGKINVQTSITPLLASEANFFPADLLEFTGEIFCLHNSGGTTKQSSPKTIHCSVY